jgi:hypothetical protein
MARKSLKDLKNAFKTGTTEGGDSRPNNYYPFYNMDFDEKAVVRFLPDLNEENPLCFLVEKLTHTLMINGERKTVPCLKNYEGESECPICTRSAQFYKDEGKDTKDGKRLYRRKQHLGQVLIVEDPLSYKEGEEPALGKVKLVNISYSVYNKIKEAFDEDELEEVPWDYEEGTDFMIKKTKKGEYANYDASKFLKRERALSEEELAAIEGNLTDLQSLLPKKPDSAFLQKMLDADLNGEVLDESDMKSNSKSDEDEDDSPKKSKKAKKSKSDEDEDDSPKSQKKASSGLPDEDDKDDDFSEDADDVLAAIRARRNK